MSEMSYVAVGYVQGCSTDADKMKNGKILAYKNTCI